MAFKRSAVRSRLSPPKKPETKVSGFFIYIQSGGAMPIAGTAGLSPAEYRNVLLNSPTDGSDAVSLKKENNWLIAQTCAILSEEGQC